MLSEIVFLVFTCFSELMCFLTVLFFFLIVSLQAPHLNLPSTEVMYSFLCSWTRCHELNFGSLCPRVERLLPAGLVCSFLSLAILAFSGVRRLAPSLLASAIRLPGPSFADSSELDVLESLVSVRHLEKRATWYRRPRDKASQKSTHVGGLRPQLLYFRINWINVYWKLTNVAQKMKKMASKNLKKPKVAENSKSCQNSTKMPKISKVAKILQKCRKSQKLPKSCRTTCG